MTDVSPSAEAVRAERLLAAQADAAALFEAVAAEGIIAPGVRDSEASAAIRALGAERFGVSRHWHKRIVRSGPNTLQPYHENPQDRIIGADDIVLADFGPVFDGWEADFGRTWVIGDDPVKRRLRDDLAEVFDAGKRLFDTTPDLTAAQLYEAVVRHTEERGWEYGTFHCGHLVGEFPHQNLDGSLVASMLTTQNTEPIRQLDSSGRQAHWILEIHLVDRPRQIGGFYEQLLTLP